MAYLANYFKRQDLSDIDVVIRLPRTETTQQVPKDITSPPLKRARREADEAADTDPLQLSSFPAHKLVMFSTEYFKAQVRGSPGSLAAAPACCWFGTATIISAAHSTAILRYFKKYVGWYCRQCGY